MARILKFISCILLIFIILSPLSFMLKQECFMNVSILEHCGEMSAFIITNSSAQHCWLRKLVSELEELFLGVYLPLPQFNQFLIFQPIYVNDGYHLSHVVVLMNSRDELVDFCVSSTHVWGLWLNSENMPIIKVASIEGNDQAGYNIEWMPVSLTASISYILFKPFESNDITEVYLKEIFKSVRFSTSTIAKVLYGKWETSCKKKKSRQTAQKSTEVNRHEALLVEKEEEEPVENTSRKRESKQREGGYRLWGPPRMNRGGNTSHSCRIKENKKNERNLQDSKRDRNQEGRLQDPRNWSVIMAAPEDWAENLTETKVFTPRSSMQSLNVTVDAVLVQNLDLAALLQKAKSNSKNSANSLATNGITQPPSQALLMSQQTVNQMSQSVAAPAPSSIKAAVGVGSIQNVQPTTSMNASSFQSNLSAYQSNYGVNNSNSQHHVQISHKFQVMVSQAGYNSCTSGIPQPCVHLPHLHTAGVSQQSASASSTKPVTTSQHQPLQQQQRVRSHKARLPPLKIPESAVVMPDDAVVLLLDVQFGALQFGTDSSPFDFTTTETNSAYPDMGSNTNSSSHVANQSIPCSVSSHTLSNSMPSSAVLTKESTYGMTSHSNVNQNSIPKELAQTQKGAGQESLLLSQVEQHKNVENVTSYINHRTNQSSNLDGAMMGNKSDPQNGLNYNSSSHDNSSSYLNVSYVNQKSVVLNLSSLVPSTVSYSYWSSLSSGASDLSANQQQQQQQSKYPNQVLESQNISYVIVGSNSYGMMASAYSTFSSAGNTYPSLSSRGLF